MFIAGFLIGFGLAFGEAAWLSRIAGPAPRSIYIFAGVLVVAGSVVLLT